MTALGLALPGAADQVRVRFADGEVMSASTRRTPDRARAVDGGRLRFVVIAARGRRCAERVESRSSSGRLLWAGDETVLEGGVGACG
jgi:hypothetical protein